ncbi:MAG: type IV pilus biogenesis/stability protein PilW [Pseudomonadota bacterium]
MMTLIDAFFSRLPQRSARKTINARYALLASLCLCLALPCSAQNAVQATSEVRTTGAVNSPRNRAKLHTELGALYLQDGNMAVALEELKTAIKADESYAPAYNVRGLLHLYLREIALAEEDFKRALNITDNDPEINNNYGWFLCQTGQEKNAIAYFLKALKNPLYQTPERAYINAGVCSQKANDLSGAEAFFSQALRHLPANPQVLIQLAGIHYKQGNFTLARQELSDALRNVEPNAEILWLAFRIEHRLGNRSGETDYANQLRRKFPESAEYKAFTKGDFE